VPTAISSTKARRRKATIRTSSPRPWRSRASCSSVPWVRTGPSRSMPSYRRIWVTPPHDHLKPPASRPAANRRRHLPAGRQGGGAEGRCRLRTGAEAPRSRAGEGRGRPAERARTPAAGRRQGAIFVGQGRTGACGQSRSHPSRGGRYREESASRKGPLDKGEGTVGCGAAARSGPEFLVLTLPVKAVRRSGHIRSE
jgi:hypothetical protein